MDKRIFLVFAGCLAVSSGAPQTPVEASIRQIKFTAEDKLTRVVIETGGRLSYHSARLRDPDRIYFDLQGLRATTGPQVIPVASHLLKRIRVSQREEGVTRVVLDVEPGVDFAVLRLSEPERLVIDLRPAGGSAVRTQWQVDLDGGGSEVFWPERCMIFSAPEAAAPANDSSLDGVPSGLIA